MPWTNAEPAVPFLIEILGDTNGHFFSREIAAQALGEIGAPSRLIMPALAAALNDPHSSVRQAVTNALLKVAPEVLTNAPPE